MIIIKAKITAMPQEMFDPMPKVIVTTTDGNEHELFEYYPDEINFSESEFLGLTLEQGRRLKYDKDLSFLKS